MNKNPSLKNLTPKATLSEITSADKNAAEMLASIGLDITRHKHETLRSVCQQQQWSEVEVLQWIKKHHTNDIRQNESSKERTLPEWCSYFEEDLHLTNKRLLSEISDDFPRVHMIHGNQYGWLKDMSWHFNQLEEKLRMHYRFKEEKFYPLVIRLHNRRNSKILHGTVHKVERALEIIEADHSQLGRMMDVILEKGNDLVNPANACTTLRILNQNLITLFEHLDHNIWLEQERFFPKLCKQLQEIN